MNSLKSLDTSSKLSGNYQKMEKTEMKFVLVNERISYYNLP